MGWQQGAQESMGQVFGFFLQASQQFLALWCHSLRRGNKLLLNQGQHL